MSSRDARKLFDLTGRVAIITGGGGLLGRRHAEAIAEAGGIPVIADSDGECCDAVVSHIRKLFTTPVWGVHVDITIAKQVKGLLDQVAEHFGRIDILINNAANNPKFENPDSVQWSRFENFPLDRWNDDVGVGLTGVFLCSQIIGSYMAEHGGGVILNIASTMAIAAPDQRIYHRPGIPEDQQMVKPPSYAAIKAGVIGFTRYLATYWATAGVRANAISPGGVYDGQDELFVKNYSHRVPFGRMADADEYKGAILFLCSDASSYMTGANLIIDGGLTCW